MQMSPRTSMVGVLGALRMLGALVASALPLFSAHADILPPNTLHLQDNLFLTENMTKEEFEDLVTYIAAPYKPLAAKHGGNLVVNMLWDNSQVNASANRFFNAWHINMYGGLARRKEVTKDALALVVCHELGHHFGGFPFGAFTWATVEGQSDYFASQACIRKAWSSQQALNAEFRTRVGEPEKKACDAAWATEDQQNLCYRIAEASFALTTMIAKIKNFPEPDFSKADNSFVGSTSQDHPKAQCRLDTLMHGALCPVTFDDNEIPGAGPFWTNNNENSERAALKNSCGTQGPYAFAARPLCWFKPRL